MLELLTQASRLTESLVSQGRPGSKRQYSIRAAAVEVSSWGPHTHAGQRKRRPAEGSLGLGLGLLSGLPSWRIWLNLETSLGIVTRGEGARSCWHLGRGWDAAERLQGTARPNGEWSGQHCRPC